MEMKISKYHVFLPLPYIHILDQSCSLIFTEAPDWILNTHTKDALVPLMIVRKEIIKIDNLS